MSMDHSHNPTGSRRSQRPWLVEALIVIGIVGFGYFAATLDDWAWNNSTTLETVDPVSSLIGR